MCRFAGWLGPVAPLSTLLFDAPGGLEVQAYAPKEQIFLRVNVDGTAIAWWPESTSTAVFGTTPGSGPIRYATVRPPWADTNLRALAPRLASRAQLAAVRSATPGLSVDESAVHPFVRDGIAFTHNGAIERFRDTFARDLLAELPDDLFAESVSGSDTNALFLSSLARARSAPPGADPMVSGVRSTILDVAARVGAKGMVAGLNVIACDGSTIVATRLGVGREAPSLAILASAGSSHRNSFLGSRFPGATLVASEPLDDDPDWTRVPEGSLVVARLAAGASGAVVSVEPLA